MQKITETRWLENHLKSVHELRDLAASAHAFASASEGVWSYLRPLSEILADIEALECTSPQTQPLYGMLFSVKDNIHVSGLPLTGNSQYPAHWSSFTAPAVRAMIEAGAVLLGKNTMDEFATGLTGIRSQQRPKNACSADHVPGGSSSGSAVAVAQGVVAFALATDTGGSGRVPAALNNIIGFKPTPGRYSTHGLLYANKLFDCIPVFTKDPDIAARVMHVMPYADDSEASKFFGPSPRVDTSASESHAGRVGIMEDGCLEFFGDSNHRTAYERAISTFLEDTGFIGTPVDLGSYMEAGSLVFQSPYVIERRMFIESFTGGDSGKLDPSVKSVIEKSSQYTGEDVFKTLYETARFRASIKEIFTQVEFFVTPTVPSIPSIQQVEGDPVAENHKLGIYTYAANALGLPVIALPYGFRTDGLPFGISIVGPPHSETRLLEILRLSRKQRAPIASIDGE